MSENENMIQPEEEQGNAEAVEVIVEGDEGDEGIEPTLASVIEAILFATDEPIGAGRLVNILQQGEVDLLGSDGDEPLTPGRIKKIVKQLNENYRESNRAFRIEQIAGGLQMMTLGVYNQWLSKLLRVRGESKLSQSALETLAILAYKQPIIRADVEAIRGVGAGEMIRSLMYKGLVKIAGRAEVIGRPLLYGTTKKFLETFGLNTLKDLPKVEELKKPE